MAAFIGTFEMYIQMKGEVKKLEQYVDETLGVKRDTDELQTARQDNKETITNHPKDKR